MVTSILKTTEVDVIWTFIYTGMVLGVVATAFVLYGTYQEYKNKDK